MMKRLVALFLAMALLLPFVAAGAEEMMDTPVQHVLTVTATDAAGATLRDALLTCVSSETGEEMSLEISAEGSAQAALNAGIYTVRAYDPATGYSARETLDLQEDTALTLVIRTLTKGSKVTVGSVTKVTGSFATDLFSANTTDMDVRDMLHGYSTVAITGSTYAVNESAVTLESTAEDGNGNKLYQFKVKEGLCYNDGTPITARDYVFSVLMQASPAMAAVGGNTSLYWQVYGYDNYNSGKREMLTGLRLVDDMTFGVTLRSDALPNFYELMLVNITPYPISVIAPACQVMDDGKGAYLQGEFTAELLQKTFLDAETGYLSHPMVTSGPYQLVSYDAQTGTVIMQANENYRGNYEGQRPLIETVTLVETTNATAVDALLDGSLDIVNKLSDVKAIDAGRAQLAEGKLQASQYLRSGLGFLSFACEQGPTASENVRKAVSYCLDQESFVSAFTGAYGQPVYSWYGLGQWMVGGYSSEMAEQVTTYPMDLEEAAQLLERAGYRYNAEGKAFDPEKDTVRYCLLQGTALERYQKLTSPVVQAVTVGNKHLLPLQLRLAKVTDNRVCELVEELLVPNLQAVGFDVQVEEMSYTEMLSQYYREETRTCNLYVLATNFGFVFDPVNTWRAGAAYQGHVNTTGLEDNELYQAALSLRSTKPGDNETYETRWLRLMKLFSDKLPAIPLYSNIYFDFFGTRVQGYAPNANWSWPSALLYSWVEE